MRIHKPAMGGKRVEGNQSSNRFFSNRQSELSNECLPIFGVQLDVFPNAWKLSIGKDFHQGKIPSKIFQQWL
jgi:hypothetical protein